MKREFVSIALLALLVSGCQRAPLSQEQIDLAACRKAITATLIDPDSAQFSEEHFGFEKEREIGRDRVYLLTVNAKNRMGGYAGRKVTYCNVDSVSGAVLGVT